MAVESIIIRANPVTAWESFRAAALRSPLAEYSFSKYRPDRRAEGGYWGVSFELAARSVLMKEMFEFGLMRHIEAWDSELGQNFEGFINDMAYTLPPNRYFISLDNMANKLWMRTDYDADGAVERSTTVSDADSIARFGTKEEVLSGGETPSLNVADQAVQIYLALRAWPKYEAQIGGVRGPEKLEIGVHGYGRTLEGRRFNQTAATGSQFASSELSDITDDVGEFIAKKEIGVNPTPTTREHDFDRQALDIIFNLGRTGDANLERWMAYVVGRKITEAVGRKIVFEPAAPAEP